MRLRMERAPLDSDPMVRGVLITTLTVTVLSVLLLVRAQLGESVGHRAVRIDNQTALPLEVSLLGADGAAVPLGEAGPRRLLTVQEVPDAGATWTFVATYGGRMVYRETLDRAELQADGWTVQVPAGATAALERAGFS
jgi:hypothetical protein